LGEAAISTTNMGYYAPSDGSDPGTWGSSWNTSGSGYIDVNFAGLTTLSLSSSNVLLTASQARNQMLRLTGTLLASVVISPDAGVLWNGIRSWENLTTGPFTITLQNSAGSVVVPQGRRGLVFLDTTNGPRLTAVAGSSTADPVPTGAKWAFYMASPPSGYTQDTSLNDYAIRLVNSTGAGTGGSVSFSTLFATTQVGATALTEAQLPNHVHTAGSASTAQAGSNQPIIAPPAAGNFSTTGTGSGQTHTHSLDMRVKYADFIIAARA